MDQCILELSRITKRFPGVTAVDNVSFDLRGGEVHCIVGENGAGKSTLMKVLAGAVSKDAGEIRIAGRAVVIDSPGGSQALGIRMIYQEFNLCPQLSIAENIFLGREPLRGRLPFIDRPKLEREASRILNRMGVTLDLARPVATCTVAEQQMVEIAKALSTDARILVMDEPSATLTEGELSRLFELIDELKTEGLGIIYISHRLDEIFRIGDRVTVMRDGENVATLDGGAFTRDEIIKRMVGRELKDELPKEVFEAGAERLRVSKLTRRGFFEDVSFVLRRGEIVGLTGLVGSGRTEVARAIFGADALESGEIILDGQAVRFLSPRDAVAAGVALLTEDRKSHGLVMGMSIVENTTLARMGRLIAGLFIRKREERATVGRLMEDLGVKTPSLARPVQLLSGGNQQKVVLAKWLYSDARVILFDEPTRGVDVGAKVEIYRLMNGLVRKGVGILMISSELPEVLGMCDRILVMHEGKIAGELTREEATQEGVMRLATGEYHARKMRNS